MRKWMLYKNPDIYTPKCWQIYYIDDDSRRRYYDCAFDYPTAAALRDALADKSIREYAVKYWTMSLNERYPANDSFVYRKQNASTYKGMIDLALKYNGEKGAVYERLITDAINNE